MKNVFFIIFFCLTFIVKGFAEEPNPVKILFIEGTKSYESQDYKRAIDLFEKALALYPNFAPSYNFLGMCHKAIGSDPEGVIWLFKKSIEVDPKYLLAYENLSKSYYSLGDYENAEKISLKALEVDPQSVTAKLTLAWTYLLGKSMPKDAIDYFEDARKNTNSNDLPYVQLGLGMAYFLAGEKFKALEMITTLKKMNQLKMADQLEKIVRQHNYKPANDLESPFYTPERIPGILVSDDINNGVTKELNQSSQGAPNPKDEGIKVYLRGKLPHRDYGDKNYGTERIHALQKRTRDSSQGN